MARPTPVAGVVGAGVAGLTAAAALQRAGWQVRVAEAAPRLRDEGVGLALWANAMAALRALGLHDAVASVAVPFDEIVVLLPDGRRRPVNLERSALPYGVRHVNVARGDLLRALAEAVGADHLDVGRRCTHVEADASGVAARFADGGTERLDVLLWGHGR